MKTVAFYFKKNVNVNIPISGNNKLLNKDICPDFKFPDTVVTTGIPSSDLHFYF